MKKLIIAAILPLVTAGCISSSSSSFTIGPSKNDKTLYNGDQKVVMSCSTGILEDEFTFKFYNNNRLTNQFTTTGSYVNGNCSKAFNRVKINWHTQNAIFTQNRRSNNNTNVGETGRRLECIGRGGQYRVNKYGVLGCWTSNGSHAGTSY